MGDCKVNMHARDIKRVEDWVTSHIARFSSKYQVNVTFYPTNTAKFWNV